MFALYKENAIERCYANKHSVTRQRLVILKTVFEHDKAISAYDLKSKLLTLGSDLNIATIYRILDFWCGLNLIHRISAINKFISCSAPEEKHIHVINCCQKCESAIETCNKAMGFDLSKGMKSLGLTFFESSHIEIPVLCSECI